MNMRFSAFAFTLTAVIRVKSSRRRYSERAQAEGPGEGSGHCAETLVVRTFSRALYSF